MIFAIMCCILCAVVGVSILCSINHKFRYYVVFTYFFVANMLGALLIIIWSLPRPRDVRNMMFVKHMFNVLFGVMGIKVIKRNVEHLESNKNYVMICNHQSALDVIGIYQVMPERVTSLAKKELIYGGTFGIAGWLAGGLVFVDRLNSEKAHGTLHKLAQLVKKRNLRVLVFPEGTRHCDTDFLPFKKGAFHLAVEAQVPIVPIVFSTYRHFLSNERKMLQRGEVIATCLPPVSTEGLTAADISALIERVRTQMKATFDESSREVQAMAKARGDVLICEHLAPDAATAAPSSSSSANREKDKDT